MDKEFLQTILEKQQLYLEGMCYNDGQENFNFGFGYCLRRLTKEFGLDDKEFGVPNKNDNDL